MSYDDIGPRTAWIGQPIDLLGHYVPSEKWAEFRFRVTTPAIDAQGNKLEFKNVLPETAVSAMSSPGRLTWVVTTPNNVAPTELVYYCTLKSVVDEILSHPLAVTPGPPISIWSTFGMQMKEAALPDGKAEIEKLLAASRVPTAPDREARQSCRDVSLIATVAPVAGNGADWDRLTYSWIGKSEDARRRNNYAKLIELCHAESPPVKVLAGYEVTDERIEKRDAFMQFLASATKNGFDKPDRAVVAAHVAAIVKVLDPAGLKWDGINLDIEVGAMKRHHFHVMKMFMDELSKHFAIVGFASYGYTGPNKGMDGYDVGGKLDFFNAQPFECCQGNPKIVTRPMTYDGKKPNKKYVDDMCKWAFEDLGLEKHQLQIGLQVDPQKQGGANKPGAISDAQVDALVRDACRANEVGIIMWGLFRAQPTMMSRLARIDGKYREKP